MRRSVLLMLLLVLGGCQPSGQVEVARGANAGGAWSAWAYQDTGNQGRCLEIRADGRDVEKLCGLTEANAGLWQTGAPPGKAGFLAVTTGDVRAVAARVSLADGREVQAPVVHAPQPTDIGYVVVILDPPGVKPQQVEILDRGGVVLTTLPLN